MASGIKFTSREMRFIALFESITGATVKDCIVDSDLNRIIFIVKEGNIGMAIGRRGKNIHLLEKMTGKKHEVIEHSENPAQFIRNALKPAKVDVIRISERPDGKTIAELKTELAELRFKKWDKTPAIASRMFSETREPSAFSMIQD